MHRTSREPRLRSLSAQRHRVRAATGLARTGQLGQHKPAGSAEGPRCCCAVWDTANPEPIRLLCASLTVKVKANVMTKEIKTILAPDLLVGGKCQENSPRNVALWGPHGRLLPHWGASWAASLTCSTSHSTSPGPRGTAPRSVCKPSLERTQPRGHSRTRQTPASPR